MKTRTIIAICNIIIAIAIATIITTETTLIIEKTRSARILSEELLHWLRIAFGLSTIIALFTVLITKNISTHEEDNDILQCER
jgi:hypothetical protein